MIAKIKEQTDEIKNNNKINLKQSTGRKSWLTKQNECIKQMDGWMINGWMYGWTGGCIEI